MSSVFANESVVISETSVAPMNVYSLDIVEFVMIRSDIPEVKSETEDNLHKQIDELLASITKSSLSYSSPILKGKEISQALELRKAGLGLLGNIIGDKKAVACIEDTAVALADLPPFIDEFTAIMKKQSSLSNSNLIHIKLNMI